MKRVRAAIEEMLLANGLRLIETRGDNYLAITTESDGPAPAARALRFAAHASRAVADLSGTCIRVGLASGHVTVATLQCMGEREVLCLFGDVVNVAGRLEQVSLRIVNGLLHSEIHSQAAKMLDLTRVACSRRTQTTSSCRRPSPPRARRSGACRRRQCGQSRPRGSRTASAARASTGAPPPSSTTAGRRLRAPCLLCRRRIPRLRPSR